jgi:hypothetical protein
MAQLGVSVSHSAHGGSSRQAHDATIKEKHRLHECRLVWRARQSRTPSLSQIDTRLDLDKSRPKLQAIITPSPQVVKEGSKGFKHQVAENALPGPRARSGQA